MSYTLTQAKDLVLNQGYAIKNNDKVEKMREVIKLVFTDDKDNAELYSRKKYFYRHKGLELKLFLITDQWHGNSINLSEIELPKQITIEMVIELTKKHTNDMILGSELRKLLNN